MHRQLAASPVTTISTRIPDDILARIDRAARDRGVSRAGFIRDALCAAVVHSEKR